MRLVLWSFFVGVMFGLGLVTTLSLVSIPYGLAIPVASLTALTVSLDLYRHGRSLRPARQDSHALCGWCWTEVVRQRASPPQTPLAQRVAEKCCRCGRVCFDGIYLGNTERYSFCEH